MPRFRVRTLMIAVAAVALVLGSINPGWKAYRRWSYHRSQAAWCWRLEQAELRRADQEERLATRVDAIKAQLLGSPEFAERSPPEQERITSNVIGFHQSQRDQARVSAAIWKDRRRDEETAAWFCWDPYAPDPP
jgi:hypothetical protein